ncbi:MAG: flagellar hook basal-body protein [Verrucomicrobiota bacterium]
MIGALHSAVSGMQVERTRLNVASNNIANATTPGFRSSDVVSGEAASSGFGARITGTQSNFNQGPMQMTGVPTDLAISGRGFFTVEKGDGSVAFTRDGSFSPDAEGTLKNQSGDTLLLEGRVAGKFPPDLEAFTIASNGQIRGINTQGQEVVLGTVTLAMFANEEGLQREGEGRFTETEASGPASEGAPLENGRGSLVSGALEMSNVDYVNELVESFTALNSFEANVKTVQTASDMLEKVTSL